jgi:thioredoxin 1
MLNPTLKEIKDTLKERISIVRIDIDKYQAIATLYRIKEVPTMMLFQNDKQLWRQSGVLSKIEILEIIMGKSMWPELPGQGK